MQRTRFLIGLLLTLACGTSWGTKILAPRTRTNLDPGWRFFLGDDAAASDPGFDDSKWQREDLPHSFSEPYFRAPDFYIGYGWYRRHLTVVSTTPHAQNFLEFEGAFQDAEVFVNGKRAGEHLGGYTGFSMDISGDLHSGDCVLRNICLIGIRTRMVRPFRNQPEW